MIHEFKILLENRVSGEESEGDGAIDMLQVQTCWASQEDIDCTIVSFRDTDRCTVRCNINDFISIWRTCTDNINF